MKELFDDAGNSRGFLSSHNRLNNLTGREWVFATRSVIPKAYPPSYQHKLRNQHGGQKPPELCAELIRTFTKAGQRVLDPMMGVGGTLLGASIEGRRAFGIEIERRWVDLYHEVCRLEEMEPQPTRVGDCREALPTLTERFDFVLTDVPYWNMDSAHRSNGQFKRAGEPAQNGRLRKNLSRFNTLPAQTKAKWLAQMSDIFALCRARVTERAYLAVFVGDMYQDGRFHFLSADLAAAIEDVGWTPKANLIWYDVSKQLHVYGYRYAFIPSMVHQNILIFRSE